MKRKLILTFIAMILIPMLILLSSIFIATKKVAINNSNEVMLRTLEQSGKDITAMIASVEFISDTLFHDNVLKRFIGDKLEKDFQQMMKDVVQLRETFYHYESSTNLFRIKLYIDDKKMSAREYVHFFPMSEALQSDWYKETLGCGGAGLWSGVYRNTIALDYKDLPLISYRRMARSGSNIFTNDGVLVLDVKEAALYSYIKDIPTRNTEKVYLLDSDGVVLSALNKDILGEKLFSNEIQEEIKKRGNGVIEIKQENSDKLLVFTRIPGSDWRLLDYIDTDYILEYYSYWDDFKLILFIFLIITLFTAASFVMIHMFNKEMVRRITQIAKRLESGEGHSGLERREESEIDKAERLVFEMIEHNRQLTEDNYNARLEERKVQLFALQAQINPHFLYNTLEFINWMAFRRGADEISTAVTTLAKYFRLSLNKGREVVSIAEEIELARTYLAIQNIRFDSVIETEITMPKDMESFSIPKLVLQPFVENAVIHGVLKKAKRSGKIVIEAIEETECIRLIVKDDGVGMKQDFLNGLLCENQNDHYGIYNANTRIHLYYGNKYGVMIESEEEVGTIVTIVVGKIPV